MFTIPIPLTDVRFLFQPRLAGLPPWLQWPMLLFVTLGPLLLMVWLYRYELRLVRPAVARCFLALRLMALALLLGVLILQPIAARTVTERLKGKVLIAFDRSGSSATLDPQRTPLEKLQLARGLGLAKDLVEPDRLDSWIAAYKEQGAISWGIAGESLSSEAMRQHDTVCQRVDTLMRTQIGHTVLSANGGDLLARIQKKHAVELMTFAQSSAELAVTDLDQLKQPPAADSLAAAFTDLRLPMVKALERSSEGGKVLGVVVLSDGQHNYGEPPVKKALELGEQGVPVYPIPLGARQPPPDVAVTALQAPANVFLGKTATVEARLQVNGLSPRHLTVTLTRPGLPPQQRIIDHKGVNNVYSVGFLTKMDTTGSQQVTITVQPTEGETRTDNNSRTAVINVADDKAKVLLIDNEVRWEQHYLASALERDESMKVTNVVFAQPRLGLVEEEELIKMGHPRPKLPAEADALLPYDCIILGDVLPEQLPLTERQRLERYVADRGGTLVILAGKKGMPLGYPLSGAQAEADPLIRLLPIEQPRVVQPEQGFPVSLTAEGRLSRYMRLEEDAPKSERRWSLLPRHYWGVVGRAKPNATTLAYVDVGKRPTNDGSPASAKAALDYERNQALLVAQNYGFGRVLYVGLDSTWRWRYKTGDLYHHKFWGQIISWAASDKPLVTGNDAIRFGTREPMYQQGQDIELVARLGDTVRPLGPDALAGAQIFRLLGPGKEEKERLLALQRREFQPRELEARLSDLPPGQYAVELIIPELSDKLAALFTPQTPTGKLRATFTVTPPDSGETVELATNYPLLEELAAKSGGQLFEAFDTAELVKRLDEKVVTRTFRVETKLWQSWWTLIVFLLFVTAEWVGRKLVGLP